MILALYIFKLSFADALSSRLNQDTDEFEREAVALWMSRAGPLLPIAEELGIRPSMLGNWRTGIGTAPQAGSPGD